MAAPSEELLEAMNTAARYFFRLMTQCLADLPEAEDVSPTQYRALGILTLRGSRNTGELAEELGVGRPAATKLVDRLVRRKLIRRRGHPTDRRQVMLEATDRGREIVRAVQLCRRRRLARVLSELDPVARDALRRDLPALTEAFERTGRASAAPPELLTLAAAPRSR